MMPSINKFGQFLNSMKIPPTELCHIHMYIFKYTDIIYLIIKNKRERENNKQVTGDGGLN